MVSPHPTSLPPALSDYQSYCVSGFACSAHFIASADSGWHVLLACLTGMSLWLPCFVAHISSLFLFVWCMCVVHPCEYISLVPMHTRVGPRARLSPHLTALRQSTELKLAFPVVTGQQALGTCLSPPACAGLVGSRFAQYWCLEF